MNKIDKLIKELCPAGVEYKEIGKVCDFVRGQTITAKGLIEGDIPVIAGGQKPAYFHSISNRDGESVAVAGSGAYAGFVSYWDIPIFVSDAFTVEIIDKDILTPKYVYYFLKNNQDLIYNYKKGGGVPHIYGKDLAKTKIPIPPIEVQKEIANILDKFVELETELEIELEAELSARKKQYEYYRDKIFERNNSFKPLGDLCKLTRGASPRPISKFITDDKNGVPWIKISDANDKSKYITTTVQKITEEGSKKSKLLKKGAFILSNSMSYGKPYILAIDGCIHDGWISIVDYEDNFNPDFLYHLLKSDLVQKYWNSKVNSGSVSNLNIDIVLATPVPVFTLEQQNKIVSILDKFDKLINDLSEGLPAEIKMRRQQYEYYRDKLLSFEEVKNGD